MLRLYVTFVKIITHLSASNKQIVEYLDLKCIVGTRIEIEIMNLSVYRYYLKPQD